jgi:cyclopropane-fatty-acyl-phospholipid synthase
MRTFRTLGRWPEHAIYYLDCMIWAAIALTVASLTCRSWQWCTAAAFGFALFTFAEYWVHRSLLHRFFYHGTHERHHKRPEEFVVIWYVPALFVLFYLVMPLPVFAGFTLGYSWFIATHHALHHWDLASHPLIARYSRWHELHHKFIRCNFGITSPLWDAVFQTYRSAPL